MTLALCAVLVAPPALRAATAIAGGLFAVGVGYAVLVLGWHFPSDVLGGFLMAGMWTSLAVAALGPLEHRAAVRRRLAADRRTLAKAVARAAALAAGVILAAYGDSLAGYAVERPIIVVGARAIAALGATLSAGLARARVARRAAQTARPAGSARLTRSEEASCPTAMRRAAAPAPRGRDGRPDWSRSTAPAEAVARPCATRSPRVAVKDAISGTWLGHALHPLLTDVPIGTLDLVAARRPARRPRGPPRRRSG